MKENVKLEIRIILPEAENEEKNEVLLPMDCLKIIDLSSFTTVERSKLKFVVCEVKAESLKSRDEPHYKIAALQYGRYENFEQALNYYMHRLTGEPLKIS